MCNVHTHTHTHTHSYTYGYRIHTHTHLLGSKFRVHCELVEAVEVSSLDDVANLRQ